VEGEDGGGRILDFSTYDADTSGQNGRGSLVTPTKLSLRQAVVEGLEKTGYRVKDDTIALPSGATKATLRQLHDLAVRKRIAQAEPGLRRHEARLLRYIANGQDVVPDKLKPALTIVEPDSEEELLFRYACLHWSIPVSSGYGRRLRFLVKDESNGKLVGLFGLGDPVYALADRDAWIGWQQDAKRKNLRYVMDAYVLGAVPPYSSLLGGKLIALLALSSEVREAFSKKYAGRTSIISNVRDRGELMMVTTTSALGRSSIYNRLRVEDQTYWHRLGYTQGSGEFQFSNGVYEAMRAYVIEHCKPTAKSSAWGTGFRNRREVIKKCLASIGLPGSLIYHGIQREIFAAPLGPDVRRFLKGEVPTVELYEWPAAELFSRFRGRWLERRASRDRRYLEFEREGYRLW